MHCYDYSVTHLLRISTARSICRSSMCITHVQPMIDFVSTPLKPVNSGLEYKSYSLYCTITLPGTYRNGQKRFVHQLYMAYTDRPKR